MNEELTRQETDEARREVGLLTAENELAIMGEEGPTLAEMAKNPEFKRDFERWLDEMDRLSERILGPFPVGQEKA